MLTIGLCFSMTFARTPGRGPDRVAHLERISSIEEQSPITPSEPVFVRGKFKSEASDCYHFRETESKRSCVVRSAYAMRGHICIPPRYQEATTCLVRTIPDSAWTHKESSVRSGDLEKELR